MENFDDHIRVTMWWNAANHDSYKHVDTKTAKHQHGVGSVLEQRITVTKNQISSVGPKPARQTFLHEVPRCLTHTFNFCDISSASLCNSHQVKYLFDNKPRDETEKLDQFPEAWYHLCSHSSGEIIY